MKTFLLFLSSFIAFCPFSLFADEHDADVSDPVVSRFAFQIDVAKGFVSGIALFSEDCDVIKGCLFNEFGVSALEFQFDKSKQTIKLLKVVSFLNKWYIKSVLKKDLRFALNVLLDAPFKGKSSYYQVVRSDDDVSILNTKRNIKYTFSPLFVPHQDVIYDTQE